jgi:DNA replication protein DnaC
MNDNAAQSRVESGRVILRNKGRNLCGLKKRQHFMRFDLPPKPGQEEAYTLCLDFANNWRNAPGGKGIMLCGSVGAGKTHLAAAIVNHSIDNLKISDDAALNAESGMHYYFPLGVKFISFTELLSQVRQCFESRDEKAGELIEKYKNTSLLVLDDLGAEKTTEWVQSVVYEIISHRYDEFLPLIITTNLRVNELSDKLGSRTADRIRAACKVVTLNIGSLRETAV